MGSLNKTNKEGKGSNALSYIIVSFPLHTTSKISLFQNNQSSTLSLTIILTIATKITLTHRLTIKAHITNIIIDKMLNFYEMNIQRISQSHWLIHGCPEIT